MSRFAQIRSAISDRPWEWLLYLLGAVYLFVVWVCALDWWGFWSRSSPSHSLAIISFRTSAALQDSSFLRLARLKWILRVAPPAICRRSLHLDHSSQFRSSGLLMALRRGCRNSFVAFQGRWRRSRPQDVRRAASSGLRAAPHLHVPVIATSRGVCSSPVRDFSRCSNVMRPWPSDRPLDEPQSPLRTMRLYRLGAGRPVPLEPGSGEHVLAPERSISPGFGVPQLGLLQVSRA